MKKCIKCEEEKAYTDFPRRKDSPDGYRNECSACKKARDAAVHKNRMAKPGAREAEALRIKKLRSALPSDEIARRNSLANEKNRLKAEQEKLEYLALHGCTKRETRLKRDKEIFIADAIARNGDRYDYSEVEYRGVWHPVKIRCNKHDIIFTQTPKSHSVGSGCHQCGKESVGNALRKTQEEFIKDATAFCGDKFTFDRAIYIDNKTPLIVTCREHGDFNIRPGNLLTGKGCRSCSQYGYRTNIPGILYVLHNGDLTKIGITNKGTDFRLKQLNKLGKGFNVVKEYAFEHGKDASDLELKLLHIFRNSYLQPTEKFDGSTECFYQLDPLHALSVIDSILKNKEHDGNRSNFQHWKAPTASCRL